MRTSKVQRQAVLVKQAVQTIQEIEEVSGKISRMVSILIEVKARDLGTRPSQDIAEMCMSFRSAASGLPKMYSCPVCGKEFDDGRKLGGHVSRAHKQETQNFIK